MASDFDPTPESFAMRAAQAQNRHPNWGKPEDHGSEAPMQATARQTTGTPPWVAELIAAELEHDAVRMLYVRAGARLSAARNAAKLVGLDAYNEGRRAAGLEPRTAF